MPSSKGGNCAYAEEDSALQRGCRQETGLSMFPIFDSWRKLTTFTSTMLSQLHWNPEELIKYSTKQAVFYEKKPDNEVEIFYKRAPPPD